MMTASNGRALLLVAAEEHNVLLPAAYDVVWSVALTVAVVLAGAALLHLGRRKDLSSAESALWALVVLLVPVVGPAVYLVGGRRPKGSLPSPSSGTRV
jgi:FtsH-binding integral membrane protein